MAELVNSMVNAYEELAVWARGEALDLKAMLDAID